MFKDTSLNTNGEEVRQRRCHGTQWTGHSSILFSFSASLFEFVVTLFNYVLYCFIVVYCCLLGDILRHFGIIGIQPSRGFVRFDRSWRILLLAPAGATLDITWYHLISLDITWYHLIWLDHQTQKTHVQDAVRHQSPVMPGEMFPVGRWAPDSWQAQVLQPTVQAHLCSRADLCHWYQWCALCARWSRWRMKDGDSM